MIIGSQCGSGGRSAASATANCAARRSRYESWVAPPCPDRGVRCSAVPARFAGRPPTRQLLALIAEILQRPRGPLRAGAARAAELPQLPRGALVAVDQLIQLEHVDLAGVQPCKAVLNPVE